MTPPIADLIAHAFTPEGADVADFLGGLASARLRLDKTAVVTVQGAAIDAVLPILGRVWSASVTRIVVTAKGSRVEIDGLPDQFVPFPQGAA